MRNTILLLGFLFVGCVGAMAQNKTLGVGTATPNPNAALHVESPTNNQGFIMPRLTTTQRLSMALTPSDMGLMVYDITRTSVYTWDGTTWSEVGDIAYPIADTVSIIPPNGAALAILYANSTVGNFGVANFQNQNPNNGFSPLFVTTNSNTNGATDMLIQNPNNINDVVGATTNGKGTAGRFTVNNTNNRFAAIYATTNGQMGMADSSAAILGETSTAFSGVTGKATGPNGSNGVTGISSSSDPFSFSVLGSATGGGIGGGFFINNPANTSNALESSTNGLGGAAKFKVTNAASVMPALWAETNSNQPLSTPVYGLNTGTGDAAGVFRINNAGSNKHAVFAETNGSGATVQGLNLGTGNGAYFRKNGSNGGSSAVWGDNFGNDGYAGIFQNISATNPKAALFAESVGTGPSIWANKTDAESGPSFEATHSGTGEGSAGSFQIINASSTSSALDVTTNGTGAGIMAENTGTGNGFAGLFRVTAASNTYPAIQATSKGTGSALRAFYGVGDGSGPGVDVFMHNTSSAAHGVIVDQQGTGDGGNFNINRTSNSNSALRAQTNSTSNGTAIWADNTGVGDAIFARANSGSGGNFQNTNASNTASVMFASTNAPNGHAIGAINSGQGSAFTIFQGGMSISTFEVTTATIATRAAAYRITNGGTTFTISFPTSTGDMYMVYNDTGSTVTFEGVSIPAGTGKVVINFNSGSFRGL